MSAYMVDAATIDAIVSAARQYGGQGGLSIVRLFPDTEHNRGGYSAHKFSRYAADDEAPETFNPNTLGRELWTENLRSIHYRYPDTVEAGNHPGPVAFTEADVLRYEYGPGSRVVEVDPLGVLGAIRGYCYQSCEHPEWRHSVAKAAVDAIRDAVIEHLIDQSGANTWTVDDLAEVTGETRIEARGETGWSVAFHRQPPSGAVSLTERMVRGR